MVGTKPQQNVIYTHISYMKRTANSSTLESQLINKLVQLSERIWIQWSCENMKKKKMVS